MPLKRQRSDPSSADLSSTDLSSTDPSPSTSNPPMEPKAKKPRGDTLADLLALRRYSPGSTSRNSAAIYLKATKNAAKAFQYECMCLDWIRDLLKDGLESNEKADGEGEPEIPSCDGGETCLCRKPASRHKNHPWILTFAGSQKIQDMRIQVAVRDPNNFAMYTNNDHAGYGVMQVLQNLIIDFERAGRIEGNWKRQWALCEAMAIFYMGGSAEPLNHVDDYESVKGVWKLISFMFLSMLITLEDEDLLDPKSKVKNLGMIMALFLQLMRKERPLDGKNYDIYVFAFAMQHKVELIGLPKSNLEMLQEEYRGNENILPEPESESESDSNSGSESDSGSGSGSGYPWTVKYALDDYIELEAPRSVGGDDLDITAWTSAERKKHHFDGEDPISDETIAAIEEGGILTFGD